MNEGVTERGLQILEMASIKELTEAGRTEYVRWQNIKRRRARLGADEVGILVRVYPQYRWWLISGEVMPELGQTSPEYDDAHRNLSNQTVG